MQKQLIPDFAKWPGRQGSILVGVVALTVVMCFATFGFLQISGSMSNNGAASIEESKAFYAVESGLLLGARYLRNKTNFNGVGSTSTPPPFSPVEINGYTIVISVKRLSNVSDSIQITANTGQNVKGTGYRKQMSWITNSNFGQFAFIMGKEHPDNGNAGDPYDWSGWGASNVWIGRLHMNSRIKLGYTKPYTFSGGPVTVSYGNYDSSVANNPTLDSMNYTKSAGNPGIPNINGFLNNFDNGVAVCASSSKGHANSWNLANTVHNNLNTWFQDKFTANVPAIKLPPAVNTVLSKGNVLPLTTSESPTSDPIGDAESAYRPTLYFGEDQNGNLAPGQVTYRYYEGGNFRTASYFVNGNVFKCNTSVNVLGVVQGKTAVVTTPGNSIVIVADGRNGTRGKNLPGIVYEDYAIVNGQPTAPGNNVLGLVSGKDIVYNKTWLKRDGASNSTITISDQITVIAPDTTKFLNVCGAIVATETATSCDHIDITTGTKLYYGIRAYGSHIVSAYRTHSQNNYGTNDDNNSLPNQYIWDERLSYMSYPNSIDKVTNANGLLMLNYFCWAEKNF